MFVIVNEKGLFWSSVLYGEYGSGWSSTNPELYPSEKEARKVAERDGEEMGKYVKIAIKELIFKN